MLYTKEGLHTSQAKGKVFIDFSNSALKDLEVRKQWLKRLGDFFEKLPSPVHVYLDGYKIADVAGFEYDENDVLALNFVAEKEDVEDQLIDVLNNLIHDDEERLIKVLSENESVALPDSEIVLVFEYLDYSLLGDFIILAKSSVSAADVGVVGWSVVKERVGCTPKNYVAYGIGMKEQAIVLFDLHNKVDDLEQVDEVFELDEEEYAFWLDKHK